jgi:PPOX class probable FMN-dependent enzyme
VTAEPTYVGETDDPWAGLPGITSVEQLVTLGVPEPAVRDKALTSLQDVHRDWIAASPLVLIATSSSDGRCDVSPKGDPVGFVRILDDRTLAIPERSGNRRMDTFHNILENPHVGLILLIPGRPDTLRVNGRARLVTDGPFFDDMVVRGHRPRVALLVTTDEIYFHCPKAFMRSRTWDPDRWQPDAVRPYAAIAKALWRSDSTDEEIAAHYNPSAYEAQLYAP